MTRLTLRLVSVLIAVLAVSVPAMAYNVVNTSAPQINCLYVTTSPCTMVVTENVSSFTVAGAAGNGELQSRIFQGQPGSTAAGKWLYRYRVIMTNAYGFTYTPWVDYVAIYNFGPPRQYDYNFDGIATDEVFNVTVGGIGTKPVTHAWMPYPNWTYFHFAGGVYSGSGPGNGESSYFFGITSDYPPVLRTIYIHTDQGWVTTTGYAPQYP